MSSFIDIGNNNNKSHAKIDVKESIRLRRKDFLLELQQKQEEFSSLQVTKF